jgi:site-specific DNA recombinase
LVWKEVCKHLLRPEFLVRAQTRVSELTTPDGSFLSSQVENAKKRVVRVHEERRRLLDAYQAGFLEKKEFGDRAQTVARRIETLESELQALQHEHQRAREGHQLLERIQEFASMLTQRLDSMSFPERQALVRAVLEEVVVCGDTVKLYLKIPLPKPPPAAPHSGESTEKDTVSGKSHFAFTQ